MNVSENIEAVQWFPDKPHPAVETNVLESGMSRQLHPDIAPALDAGQGQVGALKVKGGWRLVHPGDWIVTKAGQHTVLTDAKFQERYTVT